MYHLLAEIAATGRRPMSRAALLTLVVGLAGGSLVGCQSNGYSGPLSSTKRQSPRQTFEITGTDHLPGQDQTAPSAADSAEPQRSGGLQSVAENVRLGEQEFQAGNLESARVHFEHVVGSDPKHAQAHHRLAVIADLQKQFARAERHYLAALSQDAENASLLSDLGYSYFLQERFDESERYLNKARQIAPDHPNATANLGLLYGKQGRYDDALAMFRLIGTEEQAQAKLAEHFPNRPTESLADSSARNGGFASGDDANKDLNDPTRELQAMMAEARQAQEASAMDRPTGRSADPRFPNASRAVPDSELGERLAELDRESAMRMRNEPIYLDGPPAAPQSQNGFEINPPAGMQPNPFAVNTPSAQTQATPSAHPDQPPAGYGQAAREFPVEQSAGVRGFESGRMNTAQNNTAPQGVQNSRPPIRQLHGQIDQRSADVEHAHFSSTGSPATSGVQQLSHHHPQAGGNSGVLADPSSAHLQARRRAAAVGLTAGPGQLFPVVDSAPGTAGGARPIDEGFQFQQENGAALPHSEQPTGYGPTAQPPSHSPPPQSLGQPQASWDQNQWNQQQGAPPYTQTASRLEMNSGAWPDRSSAPATGNRQTPQAAPQYLATPNQAEQLAPSYEQRPPQVHPYRTEIQARNAQHPSAPAGQVTPPPYNPAGGAVEPSRYGAASSDTAPNGFPSNTQPAPGSGYAQDRNSVPPYNGVQINPAR